MEQSKINENSFFAEVAAEMDKGGHSTMLCEVASVKATMALAFETAKLVDAQRIANLWAGAANEMLTWDVRRALKDEALKRMGVEIREVEC